MPVNKHLHLERNNTKFLQSIYEKDACRNIVKLKSVVDIRDD